MEPEREIEKLLRAYAQKRRAEAGDSLKLHPANRRLLQGEVSRHATKPEAEEVSVSLWQWFRQQWVFLLGFALMIFLGAMLVLPGLYATKNGAQQKIAHTRNRLIEIGTAARMFAEDNNGRLPASLDEMTNELQPELVKATLTDPISGKPFIYVAGGKDLKTLSSNAVLAYSPENKKGRAVLFADGRVALVTNGDFAMLTNQRQVEFALADKVAREDRAQAAVNAPAVTAAPPPATSAAGAIPSAASAVSGEFAMQKSGVTASQSFVQAAANELQNRYRNVSASAQSAPVLQSFQVLQNGDAVSVVDRDGSVYHGSVQVAGAKRGAPPHEASSRSVAPLADQTKAVQSAATQPQVAQNYFFRVVGMNRTLKQNVVFTGNVEALPGAVSNSTQSVGGMGGGGGGQNNLQISTNQQQWQLSNSRVVGTAVIDHTNRIVIDAMPVGP